MVRLLFPIVPMIIAKKHGERPDRHTIHSARD
jgi:hypothetical protein